MAEVDETQEKSQGKKISDEVKTVSVEGRKMKLEDLKVSELKNELEKRNLDKSGLKSVLVERLKADMIEKGENPEDYDFSSASSKSATTSCKSDSEPSELNESSELNDDMNCNDEKQDIPLQLSLDEEEAQLNEDNLLENSKQLDVEISKAEEEKTNCSDSLQKPSSKEDSTSVEIKKTKENEKEEGPSGDKISTNEVAITPKAAKKVVSKVDKLSSPTMLAKSVWISGLANDTKPADLKNLFSGQGKVLSVKILKSAKQTPAKCFGLVTMANSKDAAKAIQNLNNTELNGHKITVEKKSEQSNLIKKADSKPANSTPKKAAVKKSASPKKVVKSDKASSEKKPNEEKAKKPSEEKKTEKGKEAEKSKESREREKDKDAEKRSERRLSTRSYPPHYHDRYRPDDPRRPYSRRPFTNQLGSGFRQRSSYFLQKMREERYQRERLHERREAEQRRLEELDRHRYIERKQREEAYRLEREKERLRIERELLEREKAEIIKLEREKHRLERERLERERDELRRQAELSRVSKRPFSHVDRDPEPVWVERKKPAARYNVGVHLEPQSSTQFDFPSRGRPSPRDLPPRGSPGVSRDFERPPERFSSQKRMEVSPRPFVDREPRREITIRREERQVFAKPEFSRERENSRRSITAREPPERSLPPRREVTRSDWKQERRVHERVPPSSGPRRSNYY